mmetsp:Transcript_28026/g.47407  ORF Transcript_28026/g.47407 Transcript_28026/m.47407 type:complete len:257 (-) Transcript_28026:388-1158(-)
MRHLGKLANTDLASTLRKGCLVCAASFVRGVVVAGREQKGGPERWATSFFGSAQGLQEELVAVLFHHIRAHLAMARVCKHHGRCVPSCRRLKSRPRAPAKASHAHEGRTRKQMFVHASHVRHDSFGLPLLRPRHKPGLEDFRGARVASKEVRHDNHTPKPRRERITHLLFLAAIDAENVRANNNGTVAILVRCTSNVDIHWGARTVRKRYRLCCAKRTQIGAWDVWNRPFWAAAFVRFNFPQPIEGDQCERGGTGN